MSGTRAIGKCRLLRYYDFLRAVALAYALASAVFFCGCSRTTDGTPSNRRTQPESSTVDRIDEELTETVREHPTLLVSEPTAFAIDFPISNLTDEPIEIVDTTTTCGCMAAELTDKSVAPHSTVTLTLRTTTGHVLEPKIRRGTCFVTFNTGKVLRYTAVATLIPMIEVTQERIVLRKAGKQNPDAVTVPVNVYGRDKRLAVQLDGVSGLPDGLHWKWSADSSASTEYAPGIWKREAALQIWFGSDSSFAPLRYDARLTFNIPERNDGVETRLIIDLVETPLVRVVPARAFFGRLDSTDITRRQMRIVLERVDGKPLAIAKCTTQHGFLTARISPVCEVAQCDSRCACTLLLELDAVQVDQTTAGLCSIAFSDPDLTDVAIPYSVVRRRN